MQYSGEILNKFIIPELSELTKCGAVSLAKTPNYFSQFMSLSAFGKFKFKSKMHALLVLFFRRIDFACVEYRLGRKRLLQYCSYLPIDNSQTRYVRLSVSHFETCLLHVDAAVQALVAIHKLLKQPDQRVPDDDYSRIRKVTNRIRHFDEDILGGKIEISPVWLTDSGMKCATAFVSFDELRNVLLVALKDAKAFSEMLK